MPTRGRSADYYLFALLLPLLLYCHIAISDFVVLAAMVAKKTFYEVLRVLLPFAVIATIYASGPTVE